MTMDIRPIRNDDDLDWAVAEIGHYFDSPPPLGTPESDRFDVLATLIEAYENTRFPMADIDPVACLHYAISDLGHSQAELAELFGSRSRASEILNRRRHLTLEQIRLVSEAWHLPLAVLTKPYALARDAA